MALFAMLSRLFYQKMPFKKKENLFLILQQVHTEDTAYFKGIKYVLNSLLLKYWTKAFTYRCARSGQILY